MRKDFDPDLIKSWRLLWLSSIQEVASYELQRATWLNPNHGNPHWSFVEIVESYFEQFDLRHGYGYALEHGIVSQPEVAAVSAFHAALSEYDAPGDNDYDHEAILADPKWRAVVEEAIKAEKALLELSFNSSAYLRVFKDA
jgi:hypothetical protein